MEDHGLGPGEHLFVRTEEPFGLVDEVSLSESFLTAGIGKANSVRADDIVLIVLQFLWDDGILGPHFSGSPIFGSGDMDVGVDSDGPEPPVPLVTVDPVVDPI